MRQIEVSRTIVFDAPRRARGFFEAVVADNLDTGRPDEVKLVFGRKQIRRNTQGEFATKVVTRGTDVTIDAFYKHSRIKQYLKEGRALRIETVINSPTDLGVNRRLTTWPNSSTRLASPTVVCWNVNMPVRAVPSRPLCGSGSHSPRYRRANEPERSASATHAPWL